MIYNFEIFSSFIFIIRQLFIESLYFHTTLLCFFMVKYITPCMICYTHFQASRQILFFERKKKLIGKDLKGYEIAKNCIFY